jgi:hypothetical protein
MCAFFTQIRPNTQTVAGRRQIEPGGIAARLANREAAKENDAPLRS